MATPQPAQDQKSSTRSESSAPGCPTGDHYWQYCVTCGTKLEGRKCKLICPRCGFYHSCSEP